MAGVLALSAAPEGFTVADLASRVQAMTGQAETATPCVRSGRL